MQSRAGVAAVKAFDEPRCPAPLAAAERALFSLAQPTLEQWPAQLALDSERVSPNRRLR